MPQRFNPNLYLTLCEFVVVSGLLSNTTGIYRAEYAVLDPGLGLLYKLDFRVYACVVL